MSRCDFEKACIGRWALITPSHPPSLVFECSVTLLHWYKIRASAPSGGESEKSGAEPHEFAKTPMFVPRLSVLRPLCSLLDKILGQSRRRRSSYPYSSPVSLVIRPLIPLSAQAGDTDTAPLLLRLDFCMRCAQAASAQSSVSSKPSSVLEGRPGISTSHKAKPWDTARDIVKAIGALIG